MSGGAAARDAGGGGDYPPDNGGGESMVLADNIPVTYSVAWSAKMPAMTITLLVPRRRSDVGGGADGGGDDASSPFQRIDGGGGGGGDDGMGSNGANRGEGGVERHALRIPLNHLLNAASVAASSPDGQRRDDAPWLDRTTLRARLLDGGRAIGLTDAFLHQPAAAVEESAARLPGWVPSRTVSIHAAVHLMENTVTLVADVLPAVADKRGSESEGDAGGGDNEATPSSGRRHSLPPELAPPTPAEQHHHRSPSEAAVSPRGAPASGTVPPSGPGGASSSWNYPAGQQQQQQQQQQQKAQPEPPAATHSSTPRAVSPLGPSARGGPDPESIVAPLLAMGFTERQCRVAVEAIRDLSSSSPPSSRGGGDPMPASSSSSPPSQRGQRPPTEVVNGGGGSGSADGRQITGEDIVGFLFSGDSQGGSGGGLLAEDDSSSGAADRSSAMKRGYLGHSGATMSTTVSALTEDDDDNDEDGEDDGEEEAEEEAEEGSGEGGDSEEIADVSTGNTSFASSSTAPTPAQQQPRTLQENPWGAPTQPQIEAYTPPSSQAQPQQTQQQQWQPSSDDAGAATPSKTVWGNAGKLRLVKSQPPPNAATPGVASPGAPTATRLNQAAATTTAPAAPKMVRVLDVAPDTNGFVFHCNAHTREECLERNLFGCPSGGQYGPHSKAKAGDLLFLADFSSWTVTGIFTATSDAGMNLERGAFGGRFPWQIRVKERTGTAPKLKTVHIDKMNEIIGLASGSKLNMLTKDQMMKILTSREFGPFVPTHLYKMRPAPAPPPPPPKVASAWTSDSSLSQGKNTLPNDSGGADGAGGTPSRLKDGPSALSSQPTSPSAAAKGHVNMGSQFSFNTQQSQGQYEEHPAAAMHRVKLVKAWFDSMATTIQTLNAEFNKDRPGQQTYAAKDQQRQTKDQLLVDEAMKLMRNNRASVDWPWMSYNHIRRGVGNVFNQWLFQAHAIGNREGRDARSMIASSGQKSVNELGVPVSFDESGSWIRQGRSSSSGGRKREDPVLLSNVPLALEHVKGLLTSSQGSSALCVPTDGIATVLASAFLREMERIASEVRKTQLSLIKIGGDEYLKSVEDAVLGMRVSEETTTYYEGDENPESSVMVTIEWVTKASIIQERTPPYQKVYKAHFESLSQNYRNSSSKTDPGLKHMLTRIFVLLCRYDLIGFLKGGHRAAVPPKALVAMGKYFGVMHECFASPLNRTRATYNSIFPDIDRYFGSMGSFFDFFPVGGSFEVNPPFHGDSMKMTFEHIFSLLRRSDNDKNALSFIVIVPETSDALDCITGSPFLRKTAVIHTNGPEQYYLMGLQHKQMGASHYDRNVEEDSNDGWDGSNLREVPSETIPTLLIWLQNDFGYDLWTPTDKKVQETVDGFSTHSFDVAQGSKAGGTTDSS